ncbi:hypothetical protein TIFTF001_009103 [Ficus carica]|uniref:Uncharacterized protein n=1 Tax=Ficus carica TaxID=3494 RepID=A0AA87ZVZ8_FICCA|nr:hypothetical protein TIFTF001_009103 [Ficus carica]
MYRVRRRRPSSNVAAAAPQKCEPPLPESRPPLPSPRSRSVATYERWSTGSPVEVASVVGNSPFLVSCHRSHRHLSHRSPNATLAVDLDEPCSGSGRSVNISRSGESASHPSSISELAGLSLLCYPVRATHLPHRKLAMGHTQSKYPSDSLTPPSESLAAFIATLPASLGGQGGVVWSVKGAAEFSFFSHGSFEVFAGVRCRRWREGYR